MDKVAKEPAAPDGHRLQVKSYFAGSVSYWRDVYGDSSRNGSWTTAWLRRRKEIILGFLADYGNNRRLKILDAGCGAGIYLKELAGLGHDVTGIDHSLEMVREASSSLGDPVAISCRCLVSEVESIASKDSTFDVALCVGVLQYLKRDNVAIAELSRVVKAGGIVILTIPNLFRMHMFLDPYYLYEGMIRIINKFDGPQLSDPLATINSRAFRSNRTFWNRRYVLGHLNPIFAEAGLAKLKVESVAFTPPTFWRKVILPRAISTGLNRFLLSLANSRLSGCTGFFADRWIFFLRKSR